MQPLLTNLPGVIAFSTLSTEDFADSGIILPVQTHSARVARLGIDDLNGADAIVAKGRGPMIGIRTADCLPLLMVDPEAQVYAAVHCGWRGTVAGIALNAVETMVAMGARPGRIRAAFGPHICSDCFEVGEDVASQFAPEAVERRPQWPKPHVSLAKAVSLQLTAAGISEPQAAPACSKEDSRYFSVRRQGYELTGRTITAIGLK